MDRGHVQNTQKVLKESIASKLLLLFLCHPQEIKEGG